MAKIKAVLADMYYSCFSTQTRIGILTVPKSNGFIEHFKKSLGKHSGKQAVAIENHKFFSRNQSNFLWPFPIVNC